jgi:hypothetical protein
MIWTSLTYLARQSLLDSEDFSMLKTTFRGSEILDLPESNCKISYYHYRNRLREPSLWPGRNVFLRHILTQTTIRTKGFEMSPTLSNDLAHEHLKAIINQPMKTNLLTNSDKQVPRTSFVNPDNYDRHSQGRLLNG